MKRQLLWFALAAVLAVVEMPGQMRRGGPPRNAGAGICNQNCPRNGQGRVCGPNCPGCGQCPRQGQQGPARGSAAPGSNAPAKK